MSNNAINSSNQDEYVKANEQMLSSNFSRVLAEFEIEQAEREIAEMYPIANTDFDVSFPWVGCFCKGFSRVFGSIKGCVQKNRKDAAKKKAEKELLKVSTQNALARALLVSSPDLQNDSFKLLKEKKKKKINELVQEDINKDPFVNLGFGLIAYKNLLESLIVGFMLLSCLVYPIFMIYAQGQAFGPTDLTTFGKWSLGNLGYSTVQCQVIPLDLGKMALQCPYGKIQKIVDRGVGINSSKATITDFCQVQNPLDITLTQYDNNFICSQHLNQTWIDDFFNLNCIGNTNCEIPIQKIKQQVTAIPQIDPSCIDVDTLFFIQHTCEQDVSDQVQKYHYISIITILIMLIAFSYIMIIHSQRALTKLEQVKYDMSTVTASDFTVELDISREAYDDFLQNQYRPKVKNNERSPALYLKEYLKVKIDHLLGMNLQRKGIKLAEKRAMKEEQEIILQGKDDEIKKKKRSWSDLAQSEVQKIQEKKDKVFKQIILEKYKLKVADIQFAYRNQELIWLLKSRGDAIKSMKYDQVNDFDEKINTMIRDSAMYEKLTIPVCAFITFEKDEGRDEAINYIKEVMKARKDNEVRMEFSQETIFNQIPEFTEAPDPTNIIWENRHVKGWDFIIRMIRATAIISFVLICSCLFILKLKSASLKMVMKYPSVDCASLFKVFGNDLESKTKYAYVEDALQKKTHGKAPIFGNLQCFCSEQNLQKVPKNQIYKTTDSLGNIVETEICEEYWKDMGSAKFLSILSQYSIIIINYILREITMKIFKSSGCQTYSQQMKYTTNAIFISQFCNTGFMLMIVNANFKYQGGPLKDILLGTDPDFNQRWFITVGDTIVGSMLFNIIFPLLEQSVMYLFKLMKRLVDKSCFCNNQVTRKKTRQAYVELYSGPTFYMHWKYALIMNVTYVTMLYGVGVPILFPAALLTFICLYVIEKGMLYYGYRDPPQFDEVLNNSVLHLLMLAPLFLLSFGYWMLSSKQLISNENLIPKYRKSIPYDADHYFSRMINPVYAVQNSGPAGILIIFFWIYLFIIIFQTKVSKCFKKMQKKCKCCKFMSTTELHEDFDEVLDTYYKCLDDDDREWTIVEEENCRDALSMKCLQDKYLEKLRITRIGKCHLQGIHTYDILRNPQYVQDFQYVSAYIENREQYIKDGDNDDSNNVYQSDLVRLVLNLAFLTEAEIKEFSFTKKGYDQIIAKSLIKNETKQKKQEQKINDQQPLMNTSASSEDSVSMVKVKQNSNIQNQQETELTSLKKARVYEPPSNIIKKNV